MGDIKIVTVNSYFVIIGFQCIFRISKAVPSQQHSIYLTKW